MKQACIFFVNAVLQLVDLDCILGLLSWNPGSETGTLDSVVSEVSKNSVYALVG